MAEDLSQKRCLKLVEEFVGRRVLVVGDVMLDEYIWGEVERISPEAPVPVVQVRRESAVPGGAANVANNIRALGGEVFLAGLRGEDAAGRRLSRLLRRSGIDISGLVSDRSRPTITKSRVLAGHQQAIRIDREVTSPIEPEVRRQLQKAIRRLLPRMEAVVLEDYAKGLLTEEVIREVISLASRRGIPVIVDPNANNFFRFPDATLVTPNHKEALTAAGLPRSSAIETVGRKLLRKWGARSVLVTLGEDGMCLFEGRRRPYHIGTVAREVFDVSGAGDTVVGTLALSLAAGGDLREAAGLANRAAGVVVGKLGTATVNHAEIRKALNWQ